MRRPWWLTRGVVGTGAVCAAMAVLFAWAAARAWNVEGAPPLAPAAPQTAERPHDDAAAPGVPIAQVVAAGPFRSDRQRPPRRYEPPGRTVTRAPAVRVPQIVLTGTMVYPDGGGVALVRVDGGSPAMVRIGETVQGLTLRAVAREEATFQRAGGATVVLRVARAGR